MDTADEELRDTIRLIWPLQAKKVTDLLVPRKEVLNKNHLTVGKIFGGLMILESWRNTRFGKKKSRFGVSCSILFTIHFVSVPWLSLKSHAPQNVLHVIDDQIEQQIFAVQFSILSCNFVNLRV